MKSKHTKQLPEFALATATETMTELQGVESACRKCLKGSSQPLEVTLSDANDLAPRPGNRTCIAGAGTCGMYVRKVVRAFRFSDPCRFPLLRSFSLCSSATLSLSASTALVVSEVGAF